jgi:integrase
MAGKLKDATIGRLGNGRHGDGDSLWLQVRIGIKEKNRSWLFIFTSPETGKVRQMGLGEYPLIGLKEAREVRDRMRRLVKSGIDPLEQRTRERGAEAERRERETAAGVTFRQAAEAYIVAHKAGWKNRLHAAQWPTTLEDYVYPLIGDVACSAVTAGDVLRVLQPIWIVKPETAARVRGRIEAVLDYAAAPAQGWRSGDNPARWKGNLAFSLPARSKVAPVEHHAAMPWQDLPVFMRRLAARRRTAALALRFTILTACRTSEVLGARWSEVNLTEQAWTIPANRMKAGREHRVPLADAAMAVLAEAAKRREGDYVFPSIILPTHGLSRMGLLTLLRREGQNGPATVHGFRSSFRDWAGETTNHPREVVEMALAHRLGDKAEQSYARGDLFQKRRRLMEEWGSFCTTPAEDGVVDFPRAVLTA